MPDWLHLALRAPSSSNLRLDRRAVRGQVLRLGERHHVVGDVGERVPRVVDDVDAAQEGLHGQAGGVAGAAAGGQHVVGAGRVVAERDRRPGADEDRAGVAHPVGDGGGVARSGSPGARRRTRRRPRRPSSTPSTRTIADCRPASAGAIRSSTCLVAATCGSSSLSTASASSDGVGDEDGGGQRVVLGLADQVGGDVHRVGGVVGEDRDLGGAGLGVDADPALEVGAWRRRPRCCRGR